MSEQQYKTNTLICFSTIYLSAFSVPGPTLGTKHRYLPVQAIGMEILPVIRSDVWIFNYLCITVACNQKQSQQWTTGLGGPVHPSRGAQDLTFLGFITYTLWDIHWGFLLAPQSRPGQLGLPAYLCVLYSVILDCARYFDLSLLLQVFQFFHSRC